MATDLKDIPKFVQDVRRIFNSGKTKNMEWRRTQLKRLSAMISENINEWEAALEKDLGIKSSFVRRGVQLQSCIDVPLHFERDLTQLLAVEKKSTPLLLLPGYSEIHKEPYGVVLIIAPWNYPVSLLCEPLAGAIAAGNAAIIKPSEVSPTISALFAKLVPKYLDSSAVKVVEGGVTETTELLKLRFDYIFYTGNSSVGKIVMKAASENLTPVTLELGGKSPCIIDVDCNLDVAVKRIIWGKLMNCGQTCIAPDYILVVKSIESILIDKLIKTIKEFYGENPQTHTDYARIINERHTQRLAQLIEDAKKDCELVFGGNYDISDRYVAPTILKNVSSQSSIMKGEIFGPIIPVISISDVHEACEFINQGEKPLALYLFTENIAKQEYVLKNTSSGGVCVNDCIMQITNPNLPFGGVGESGMGFYHGRYSIDTFSHHKSVLRKKFFLDSEFRYPPYTPQKLKAFSRLRAFKISKPVLYGTGILLYLGVALYLGGTSSGQETVKSFRNFLVSGLKTLIYYIEE